jgi:hypothetical protein
MSQATSFAKSKVEIIFYISHLNLAPCIAIMFPFCSLHLPKVTIETNKGKGGEGGRGLVSKVGFKQNFTMKCG